MSSEKSKRLHPQEHCSYSKQSVIETEDEQLRNPLVEPSANQTLSERRRFLKLPKAERDRILREQAEQMADFYEHDTEWREWSVDPILEYGIPF